MLTNFRKFFGRSAEPEFAQSDTTDPADAAKEEERLEQERRLGKQITAAAEEASQLLSRLIREVRNDFRRAPAADGPSNPAYPTRYRSSSELVQLLAGGAVQDEAPSAVDAAGEEPPRNPLQRLMQHRRRSFFARKCSDAPGNLAAHLLSCVRILRLIELEKAADLTLNAPEVQEAQARSVGPTTVDACQVIEALVEQFCADVSGANTEQLRQHLRTLATLSCERYPREAMHIQKTAATILKMMARSRIFNRTTVWFMHESLIVNEMVSATRVLVRRVEASTAETSRSAQDVPVDLVEQLVMSPAAAEESGCWITALDALTTICTESAEYDAALLHDLHDADGYDLINFIVRESSPEHSDGGLRLLAALCCTKDMGSGSSATPDAAQAAADPHRRGKAMNQQALKMLQGLLVEALTARKDEVAGKGRVLGFDEKVGALARGGFQRDDLFSAAEMLARLATVQAVGDLAASFRSMGGGAEAYLSLLLDSMLQIYSSNPLNYELLEGEYSFMSLLLVAMPLFRSEDLRVMTLKALEFIGTVRPETPPSIALRGACATLAACAREALDACREADGRKIAPVMDCLEAVLSSLDKLLQFDGNFGATLIEECSILEDFCGPLLRELGAQEEEESSSAAARKVDSSITERLCCVVCGLLTTLIGSCPESAQRIRSAKVTTALHRIIEASCSPSAGSPGRVADDISRSAAAALRVLNMSARVGLPGLRQDIEFLNGMLRKASVWKSDGPSDLVLAAGSKTIIIRGLKAMLRTNPAAPGLWRKYSGFEAVVHFVFVPLDGAFELGNGKEQDEAVVEAQLGLFTAAVELLVIAMQTDPTRIAPGSFLGGEGGLGFGNSADKSVVLDDAAKSPGRTNVEKGEYEHGLAVPCCTVDTTNRRYLRSTIGYELLTSCVLNSKVLLHPVTVGRAASALFMLITLSVEREQLPTAVGDTRAYGRPEKVSSVSRGSSYDSSRNSRRLDIQRDVATQPSRVSLANPEAALVVLDCIPHMTPEYARRSLWGLQELVVRGGLPAERAAVSSGWVRHTFRRLWHLADPQLGSVDEEEAEGAAVSTQERALLAHSLLAFLRVLCTHGISSHDWVAVLQCAGAQLALNATTTPPMALLSPTTDDPSRRSFQYLRGSSTPLGHWLQLNLRVARQEEALPMDWDDSLSSCQKRAEWARFEEPFLDSRRVAACQGEPSVPYIRVGSLEVPQAADGLEQALLEKALVERRHRGPGSKMPAVSGGTRFAAYLEALASLGARHVFTPDVSRALPPTPLSLSSAGSLKVCTGPVSDKVETSSEDRASERLSVEGMIASFNQQLDLDQLLSECDVDSEQGQELGLGLGSVVAVPRPPRQAEDLLEKTSMTLAAASTCFPSASGYSISVWFRFDVEGDARSPGLTLKTMGSDRAREDASSNRSTGTYARKPPEKRRRLLWLASLCSSEHFRPLTQWYFDPDQSTFELKAGDSKGRVTFSLDSALAAGEWHHAMLSHSRGKRVMGIGNEDVAVLFVNGLEIASEQIPNVSFTPEGAGAAGVALMMGVPPPEAIGAPDVCQSSSPLWHLGPVLVLDEPVERLSALAISLRGPAYSGNFEGNKPENAAARSADTSAMLHRIHHGIKHRPMAPAPLNRNELIHRVRVLSGSHSGDEILSQADSKEDPALDWQARVLSGSADLIGSMENEDLADQAPDPLVLEWERETSVEASPPGVLTKARSLSSHLNERGLDALPLPEGEGAAQASEIRWKDVLSHRLPSERIRMSLHANCMVGGVLPPQARKASLESWLADASKAPLPVPLHLLRSGEAHNLPHTGGILSTGKARPHGDAFPELRASWCAAVEGSGVPAVAVYGPGDSVVPSYRLEDAVGGFGGIESILPLLQAADDEPSLVGAISLIASLSAGVVEAKEFLLSRHGYEVIAFMLSRKIDAELQRRLDNADSALEKCTGFYASSPLVMRALLPLAVSGSEGLHAHKLEMRSGAGADVDASTTEKVMWMGVRWRFCDDFTELSKRVVSNDIVIDPDCVQSLLLNHQLWGLSEQAQLAYCPLFATLRRLIGPLNCNGDFNALRLAYQTEITRWLLQMMTETDLVNSSIATAEQVGEQGAHQGSFIVSCAMLLYELMLRCSVFQTLPLQLREDPSSGLGLVMGLGLGFGRTQEERNQRDLNRCCEALLATLQSENRQPGARFNEEKSDFWCSLRYASPATNGALVLPTTTSVRLQLLQILLSLIHGHRNLSVQPDARGAPLLITGLPEYLVFEQERALEEFLVSLYSESTNSNFWRAVGEVLTAEWFVAIFESSADSASAAVTLRILAILLQLPGEGHCLDFATNFLGVGGFRILLSAIPRHASEQAVLVQLWALFLRVPIQRVPLRIVDGDTSGDVYSLTELEEAFSSAPGPNQQSAQLFVDIWTVLCNCFLHNLRVIATFEVQQSGPAGVEASDAEKLRYENSKAANTMVLRLIRMQMERSSPVRRFFREKDILTPLVNCLFKAHELAGFSGANSRGGSASFKADEASEAGMVGDGRLRDAEDPNPDFEALEAFAGSLGQDYTLLLADVVISALFRGCQDMSDVLENLTGAFPSSATPREILLYHDAVAAACTLSIGYYLRALATRDRESIRPDSRRSAGIVQKGRRQSLLDYYRSAAEATPEKDPDFRSQLRNILQVPAGATNTPERIWTVLSSCLEALKGLQHLFMRGYSTGRGLFLALRCSASFAKAARSTLVHGMLRASGQNALQLGSGVVGLCFAVSLMRELRYGGALGTRQAGSNQKASGGDAHGPTYAAPSRENTPSYARGHSSDGFYMEDEGPMNDAGSKLSLLPQMMLFLASHFQCFLISTASGSQTKPSHGKVSSGIAGGPPKLLRPKVFQQGAPLGGSSSGSQGAQPQRGRLDADALSASQADVESEARQARAREDAAPAVEHRMDDELDSLATNQHSEIVMEYSSAPSAIIKLDEASGRLTISHTAAAREALVNLVADPETERFLISAIIVELELGGLFLHDHDFVRNSALFLMSRIVRHRRRVLGEILDPSSYESRGVVEKVFNGYDILSGDKSKSSNPTRESLVSVEERNGSYHLALSEDKQECFNRFNTWNDENAAIAKGPVLANWCRLINRRFPPRSYSREPLVALRERLTRPRDSYNAAGSAYLASPVRGGDLRSRMLRTCEQHMRQRRKWWRRFGLPLIALGGATWREIIVSLKGSVGVWEAVRIGAEGRPLLQQHRTTAANSPYASSGAAEELATIREETGFPPRWKLSLREGFERMRRCLERNHEFYDVFTVVRLGPSLPQLGAPSEHDSVEDTLPGMERQRGFTEGKSDGDASAALDDDARGAPDAPELGMIATPRRRAMAKRLGRGGGAETGALGHGSLTIPEETSELEDAPQGGDQTQEEDELIETAKLVAGLSKRFSTRRLHLLSGLEDDEDEADANGDEAQENPLPAGGFASDQLQDEPAKLRFREKERSLTGSLVDEAGSGTQLDVVPEERTQGGMPDLHFEEDPMFDDDDSDVESRGRKSSSELHPNGSARNRNYSGGEESAALPEEDTHSDAGPPYDLWAKIPTASEDWERLALPAFATKEEEEQRPSLHPGELLLSKLDPTDARHLRLTYDVTLVSGLETKQGLLCVSDTALTIAFGFGKRSAGPPRADGRTNPLYGVHVIVDEEDAAAPSMSMAKGVPDGGNETKLRRPFMVLVRQSSSMAVDNPLNSSVLPELEHDEAASAVKAQRKDVQKVDGRWASSQWDEDATTRLESIRIPFDDLYAVYRRNYQLRPIGLEVFDIYGLSVLMAFEVQDASAGYKAAEEVLRRLLSHPAPRSIWAEYNIFSSTVTGNRTYRTFIKQLRSKLQKAWLRGTLSNFEYLLHLNALAGRSFNDLTQYPVFPWILADYTSETLDLNDPKSFRDLSKPMGALGDERAQQFKDRYDSFAAPSNDGNAENLPPPFHYGTHYSCAGYVLYYLLRLEPYSRAALTLQDGKFDKTDRLFKSIESSWRSSSSENLQDVRELIPEFFYLPEFLRNSNRFDFGVTQKNVPVHHVELPPWAKGDAREFVRLHRQALESLEVSHKLHLWIDLVFGSKQQGEPARKAQNVFVHVTYEGAIDIDEITDPIVREATIAQIQNFGVTPSRIFKADHPARQVPFIFYRYVSNAPGAIEDKSNISIEFPATAWHAPVYTPPLSVVGLPQHSLLQPAGAVGDYCNGQPVGDATLVLKTSVSTTLKGVEAVPRGCVLLGGAGHRYFRYGIAGVGGVLYLHQHGAKGRDGDRVLSIHEGLGAGSITSVGLSHCSQILVTGSSQGRLRSWQIKNDLKAGTTGAKGSLTQSLTQAAALPVTLALRHKFGGGHDGAVTIVRVASDHGFVVSGGVDRRVLLWNLHSGVFLRLLGGHTSAISSIDVNQKNGDIVTLSGDNLRLWSCNGDALAFVNTVVPALSSVDAGPFAVRAPQSPATVAVSTHASEWLDDGGVIVTGHQNGGICIWSLRHPSDMVEKARAGGGTIASPKSKDLGGGFLLPKFHFPTSNMHRAGISFLKVVSKGRELLVGDTVGKVSRWAVLRLEELPEEDALRLRQISAF